MKLNIFGLAFALGFCLFMGVTAISMGVGALVPSINQVAAPVVCPNGEMVPTTRHFNPYPGKVVTSVDWACVDAATGTRTPVDKLAVSVIAGSVHGLLLFVPIFFLMILRGGRRT